MYHIVVDGEPDEDAAWTPTWACAAFRWHEPLAPGDARTDTFRIDGPTGWDGRTGQPIGLLEGRFRLEYDLRTCWSTATHCPAPDSLGISNAFEVRLPSDTARLRRAAEAASASGAGSDSVTASLYRRLVQADLDRGDLEAADRDSRGAVAAVEPSDARLWALRAVVLHRRGRPAEALAAVDSAIAADSSYREGYLRRGLLQIEVGREVGSAACGAGIEGAGVQAAGPGAGRGARSPAPGPASDVSAETVRPRGGDRTGRRSG